MRVIQWGLGNVGRHSLRGILERPELELVGLRVYSPDKVGRDAGFFVDVGPTGVVATNDAEQILALDADCVLYNSLGSALMDLIVPVNDLVALLASGKNVVSSAIDAFVYLKPDAPTRSVRPGMIEQIKRACQEGRSSIFSTGMTPGFAIDLWPVMMSRVCRRIEQIRVREIVNLRDYQSEMMPVMGFGLRPDEPCLMHDHFKASPADAVYVGPLTMMADATGVAIDEITYQRQVEVASKEIVVRSGTFHPGTVVGIRFQFVGWVEAEPFVTLDFVWRADDGVAPNWPAGHCSWQLELDGDPTLRTAMDLATGTDAKRPTSLTVAMSCLNAVPAVVAASPGIIDCLSLAPVPGRAAASLKR